MDVLCCFPSQKGTRGRDVNPGSENEKDKGQSPESPTQSSDSDLFSDERASYQRDLWQLVLTQSHRALRDALARSKVKAGSILGGNFDLVDIGALAPETCLESLAALYGQNRIAQRMPRIRAIFQSIEPFTAAVSTMAQTNMFSALLWGSLCLVFQVRLCVSIHANARQT